MRLTSFLALLSLALGAAPATSGRAQSSGDDRETDPAVLKKLEWFQDQKFGLLIHWGPYSQWGVVESWSICSEDEPWCQRKMDNYEQYCHAYEKLKETFNPVKFNPDDWAACARAAGMKYLVFTTKHHDGFCMFDTRETDYKITDTACPFHTQVRANVSRALFAAFRAQGFGIGVYFSKPDWHSPYYWNPYWAHADRNVNYSVDKHPDLWQKFRRYTYSQIEELMSDYGHIDILWLDGGWVNAQNREQDIAMADIARMARTHQQGLIIVDRAVGGRFENYRTPEQEVPASPPGYVWETCMTMGTSWSYAPNDIYKSVRTLVHLLVDIVAKGGNLLLNIGPSPEGELPAPSLERLKEIGSWMNVNGAAIYATRPLPPYGEGPWRFTREKSGAINAIYLAGEGERTLPRELFISAFAPAPGSAVRMLGSQESLPWHRTGKTTSIDLPDSIREHPPCSYAWTFRIESPESGKPR